jgi:hypothetical protein
MTDEELDEVFSYLSALLSDLGLNWLVAQVNEEIQVGRIVTRTFHHGEPEEAEPLYLNTKTTGKTVIGTDPYRPVDRVNLLVSAVRVALADCANLEAAVGQFFSDDSAAPSAGVVISAPDREISGDNEVVIVGGDNHAATAAQRTLPLLDELTRRTAEQ